MLDHLSSGKWWDIGIDLVTGCTPVSPACDHCWSAERTHRAGQQNNLKIQARYGGLTDKNCRFTGEVRPQWDFLDRIGAARKPTCYTFWNDLFHPGVPDIFVDEVMARILLNRQHFCIICTKRPEHALQYCLSRGFKNEPNVFTSRLMLMTTVERQEEADLRLPILLQIPGVLHGVSYEPALGPVDFTNIYCPGEIQPFWSTTGGHRFNALQKDDDHYYDSENHLDWLICGGETGPHARPMHPDWPRQARDQAIAAGVPFFIKALHINGKISKNMHEWPEDLRIRQVPYAL